MGEKECCAICGVNLSESGVSVGCESPDHACCERCAHHFWVSDAEELEDVLHSQDEEVRERILKQREKRVAEDREYAREEAEWARTVADLKAWLHQESRTSQEHSDKVRVLEQKVACEPNKWVSHYALAEFLDKCWSAHIERLRVKYERFDWESSGRSSDKEASKEYWEWRRRACESYLRAIALGIQHPLYSATAKLRYAILLGESGWPYLADPESPYDHIGPIQGWVMLMLNPPTDYRDETIERIRHYAREAEKDLRKCLREYPDNVGALRKLAQALAFSGGGVRSERLMAIDARIEEAEIRRQMGVAPSSQLASPGAPESPYPDNWNQLSEVVKHRDGHKCTDCGASGVELHVHHIVPLSKGGTNDLDNLTTLCSMCHSMIHPRMGDIP